MTRDRLLIATLLMVFVLFLLMAQSVMAGVASCRTNEIHCPILNTKEVKP